jgi:hypothetical protein
MPTVCKTGIERPVVVGHSLGALVRIGARTGPSGRGERSCLIVGPTSRADVPLLSLPAIPVIGDLIRYTVGPLFGAPSGRVRPHDRRPIARRTGIAAAVSGRTRKSGARPLGASTGRFVHRLVLTAPRRLANSHSSRGNPRGRRRNVLLRRSSGGSVEAGGIATEAVFLRGSIAPGFVDAEARAGSRAKGSCQPKPSTLERGGMTRP